MHFDHFGCENMFLFYFGSFGPFLGKMGIKFVVLLLNPMIQVDQDFLGPLSLSQIELQSCMYQMKTECYGVKCNNSNSVQNCKPSIHFL